MYGIVNYDASNPLPTILLLNFKLYSENLYNEHIILKIKTQLVHNLKWVADFYINTNNDY